MKSVNSFLKGIFVWMAVLVLGAQVSAQTDSAQQARIDSTLEAQQQNTDQFLLEADSIRKADSLERLRMIDQITNLKAADAAEKERLARRLDSLQQAQIERNLRIKASIDSMRNRTVGIPALLFKDTVFFIYNKLGPFSPKKRADNFTKELEGLLKRSEYDSTKLHIKIDSETVDVMHDEIILTSVNDKDAFWLDMQRAEMANHYIDLIKAAVKKHEDEAGFWANLKRISFLIGVLLLFFFGIKYMNKGFTYLNKRLVERGSRYLKGVRFKNYEFLSIDREITVVRWVLRAIKWIVISIIVYISLPVVFSIFPATKGIANTLFGYVLNPLKAMVNGVVGYIPELITIVVIILITRAIVRFLRFLSTEVESGKLELPGFYPDWAKPTFNLIKILVYTFAFIVIFPYLPGSDSPVFQGVSVFLGILISLGSSSAIGNIIAGLVITYMRAFKIGDRVKIGDTTGDVLGRTMLVTRLRTIKNEDVTIPNSMIMNGTTINYTSSATELGLILNSTVTIGYDVPWRQVHELLISAALKCDHVQETPQPFVLQTSLDDYYVSYQINAYTAQAGMAARIYSQLHSNIQDAFNAAGVEILSPHYRAGRDGSATTIPPDYPIKDQGTPHSKKDNSNDAGGE